MLATFFLRLGLELVGQMFHEQCFHESQRIMGESHPSCNQYNFQFDLDARLQLAINDTMCFPLFNKHQ